MLVKRNSLAVVLGLFTAIAVNPVIVDSAPVSAAVIKSDTVAPVQVKAPVDGKSSSKATRPAPDESLAQAARFSLEALKNRPAGPVDVSTTSATVPAKVETKSQTTTEVSDTDATVDQSDYSVGQEIPLEVSADTQGVFDSFPVEPFARYKASMEYVGALVSAGISDSKPAELNDVWIQTDVRRMTVILTALSQVGTKYRWTGNKPGGFDCSGLTSYSWAQAGVKIPRTSSLQINATTPRTLSTILPGDLMWRPGHIGLSLGFGDYMVDSPQTGKSVEVRHSGRILRYGSPIG